MGKKPDIQPQGKIKLVDVPRMLASNGVSATYNACYSASVNGLIPAERTSTGSRWVVDAENFPSVIKYFSLTKEEPNDQKDS